MSARRRAYQTMTGLAAGLLTAAGTTALWAGTTAEWKARSGNWEEAAMWGGTLPSRTIEARVSGTKEKPSQVTLAHGDMLVSHLSVAEGSSNVATLVLD